MWLRQYVKELKAHRGDVTLILGAVFGWYVYLFTRVGIWPAEMVTGLSLLPSGFLPIWIMWTSVQLYRSEWRENTAYLMLSLPVRARVITTAKLAALLTGAALFSAFLGGGALFLAMRSGVFPGVTEIASVIRTVGAGWLVGPALVGVAHSFVSFSLFVLSVQTAFVFSRLFDRFQGFIMAWTWLVIAWFSLRYVGFVAPLLSWMPKFKINVLTATPTFLGFTTVSVESGAFWALVILLFAFIKLLNVTLERAIEV